jgi:hypothetical protein
MPKVDIAMMVDNGETIEYPGKAVVALATGLYGFLWHKYVWSLDL